MNPGRAVVAPIVRQRPGARSTDQDLVAVESPLEIVLYRTGAAEPLLSLGLVMRTPGDDRELVGGLLFSEQIIAGAGDIAEVTIECESEGREGIPDRASIARVTLASHVPPPAASPRALDRTSACGMCGRLALQSLVRAGARTVDEPRIDPTVISELPKRLRVAQAVFDETGGLHAAALCDLAGDPWVVREDVGRHNAVDKVVGAALAVNRLPAADSMLAVSGRVAYEIVQKAALAGVVAVIAVGAPTSLAIEAARSVGMTLVGFARDDRFNVYSGSERVRPA